MNHFLRTPLARQLLALALNSSLLFSLPALAAPVTLATSPLATSSSSTVSPNLMFMLDDSGSMDWDYMPDTAKNFSGKYGFNSSQCNGTYYNPTITYAPPVTSTGVSYANSSFTSAWVDGYVTTAGTTNLNTSFTGGSGSGSSGSNLTAQQAFYYTYSGTQTTSALQNFYNTSSTFYQECNSAIGSSPGLGVFTKHLVTATSGPGATDERTNFANWYSYYSTRMLMMKTGVGQAFKTMNSKFRVGFMTMNNNVSPDIVDIATFDVTQKSNWYTKLYEANPGQSTPLRQALSQVGQLYANKFGPTTTYTATITVSGSSSTTVSSIQVNGVELMAATSASDNRSDRVARNVASEINSLGLYDATASGSIVTIIGPAAALGHVPVITKSGTMTFTATVFTATTVTAQLNGITPRDPIQYSCQKNFVILSTDGYWNGNAGYKLDGSAIGNQDGLAARAMYDGETINQTTSRVAETKTHVALSTSQTLQRITQIQTSTSTLQSTAYALQSSTANLQSTAYALQSSTANLQSTAYALQSSTANLQIRTGLLQQAISNDGGSTWSAWSNVPTCTWDNNGSGRTKCQYAAMSAWSNATSTCTTVDQSGSTSNGTTWTGNKTNCQYTSYSTPAAGSCTYQGKSAGSPYTVLTATTCSYATTSPTVINVASCTPVAYTTSTTNGTIWDPAAHTCAYAAYSTAAAASSCTYQNKSAAAPYAGPAVTCSYATTAPTVSTVTSCTPVAYTTSTTNGTIWDPAAHTCAYAAYSTAAAASSCTYQNKSTAAPYAGPAVTCSYATTAPTVSTVTSCTPVAYTTSTTNGTTWDPAAHTCGYSAFSAWANTSSCTPIAQSTASPYVGPAIQCQTTDTGWVGVSSCSPSGPTAGQTVTCNTATTGGATNYVAACTPAAAAAGNSWTATSCTTTTISGPALVASCTAAAASAGNSFVTTTCNTTSSVVNNASSCTAQTASVSNGYTTITCTGSGNGTSDTLADTAMYYYQTDLRDSSLSNCTGVLGAGIDVCENNVRVSGLDNNDKQHLTTFTLGLGARGRMAFSSTYLTDTSGDFYSVSKGTTAAPPSICSWQTSGACNWPVPSSGAVENIDDLWHAAIDGRGTYFNATDPTSLSAGLSQALKNIDQVTGAAAAAATSTLNPVADNNFAYVASYTTVKWIGNLEQRTIDINTGVVSQTASWCVENIAPATCIAPNNIVADTSGSSTIYYCASTATDINLDGSINATDCTAPAVFDSASTTCRDQIANSCVGTLPAKVFANSDTRNIYTANSTGTALVTFDAAYATANPTNFSAAHISGLSQWTSLTAAQQTTASGINLINFLRGQNGYEENRTGNSTANWLYRYRDAVLGDALESQPTFVSKPTFSYADPGYSNFVSAQTNRAGTVFIGANDGMLHAFAATNGVERWAYIPSVVIPNMWHLADKNYSSTHVNFVNGPPVISDICTANCTDSATAVWRTILVGGLNAGGRGYYALDITDPVTPTLLWEFTPAQSANLGYSYSRPVVTKKLDGTWVVLVASGYDNGTLSADNATANSPTGDGLGYLYVLNAATGASISAISTNVGSATTPSGFAKFGAYSDVAGSNVAGFVYGGDLLGNVWRFDINTAAVPLLFATLKDPSGSPQPITAAPTLGKIKGKRVIFVGTGKYLETSDLPNTQRQTLYAIKDDNATATLVNPGGSPRTSTTLVQQTITPSSSTRTGTSNAVDFTTGRGWYVDFPDTGERTNIDFKLVQGTLLVPTIVPSNTICSPGGYGWLNYFNYETGAPVDSTALVSQKYDSTIVGMNVIYIGGQPIVEIVTSSNPTPEKPATSVPFRASAGGFLNTREIWRELTP